MYKRAMLELGTEYILDDKRLLIDEIQQSVISKFNQLNPPDKKMAHRDAHPKTHGCVYGEFIINEVPDNLQHGLFSRPRSYPAWIRFSAGSPSIQSDSKRDIHGMAIKLMDVPGKKLIDGETDEQTHDFLMANHDIYFVRNLADYRLFTRCIVKGNLFPFFVQINPLRIRVHELIALLTPYFKVVENPLSLQYWSQTPYKLGPFAIKFTAKPINAELISSKTKSGYNGLTQAMAAILEHDEIQFDFGVQVQSDQYRMPIEDATVRWPEKLSPFQKVATIRIPPQKFDYPDRMIFAENLSFTPWHALPEHRPLGGINRARLSIYSVISEMRHQANGVKSVEPNLAEFPNDY